MASLKCNSDNKIKKAEMGEIYSMHRMDKNKNDVVDGRITLKLILNKWGVRAWNEFIWLMTDSSDRFL
jgi:hypothetical protein